MTLASNLSPLVILPDDIHTRILDFLSIQDVCSLSLTCSDLYLVCLKLNRIRADIFKLNSLKDQNLLIQFVQRRAENLSELIWTASENQERKIHEILEYCSGLQHLSVRCIFSSLTLSFTEKDVNKICNYCPYLRSVDLSFCPAIRDLSNLLEMKRLSVVAFPTRGISSVPEMLIGCGLNLRHVVLPRVTQLEVTCRVIDNLRGTLETIEFSWCNADQSVQCDFIKDTLENSKITTVTCHFKGVFGLAFGYSIHRYSLEDLFRQFTGLNNLNLDIEDAVFCKHCVDQQRLLCNARVLPDEQFSNEEVRLTISQSNLGGFHFTSLISELCSAITFLAIRNCKLDDDLLDSISRYCPNIESIQVQACKFTVTQALTHDGEVLQKLDCVEISDCHFSQRMSRNFAIHLASMRKAIYINVDRNRYGNFRSWFKLENQLKMPEVNYENLKCLICPNTKEFSIMLHKTPLLSKSAGRVYGMYFDAIARRDEVRFSKLSELERIRFEPKWLKANLRKATVKHLLKTDSQGVLLFDKWVASACHVLSGVLFSEFRSSKASIGGFLATNNHLTANSITYWQ